MKKILATLLSTTMILSLAACGSGATAPSSAPETTPAPASETAAPADTAPEAPVYDEITLKLSHHNAADQPIHAAFESWAKKLDEKSGGAVKIDIYPAASLYSQTDAHDAVTMGTLDMCLGDTSMMSNNLPAYTLFSLPFLLDSYETGDALVYGQVGQDIDKLATEQLNMVPLGWTWNGFRNICTKDPITTIEDCKDYKLRSPESAIYLDTFNTLGMSPTVVTWSEAYTAMQSGMVDGLEAPVEAFYTQGFYEMGNNILLSRHMISIIGPVINVNKWNSLNEATQQLMMETWAECQSELNTLVMSNETGYVDQLRDAGCNITEFEDPQAVVDLFTPYWSEAAEAGGYTEFLDAALAIKGA